MEILGAIIVWALFGLIVGAIARLLYPGRQAMGLGMTMMLGVAGSFIGGMIGWVLTGGRGHPLEGAGWILSIIGALIAVWIYLAATGRRRTT